MTYGSAAAHPANKKERGLFCDIKRANDGADESWCILNDMTVAHFRGSTSTGVLVAIPVKVLKHTYRLAVREISHEEWHRAKLRFNEATK